MFHVLPWVSTVAEDGLPELVLPPAWVLSLPPPHMGPQAAMFILPYCGPLHNIVPSPVKFPHSIILCTVNSCPHIY